MLERRLLTLNGGDSNQWVDFVLQSEFSNKKLATDIAKLCGGINVGIGLPPVGQEIFPRAEAALAPEMIAALSETINQHRESNAILEIERRMQGIDGSGVGIPSTPEEHIMDIYHLARQLPQSTKDVVFITGSQLFSVANHHPVVGYYKGEYGIGQIGEEQTSAFITPLEWNESYRQTYGALIEKVYLSLSELGGFTPEDPFRVIIVGDGEGRIIEQAINKAKTGGYEDRCEIVAIDISEVYLTKQQEVARQSGMPIEFVKGDGRRIGDLLANKLNGARGVIIAGEELVDTFPSYTIGWDFNRDISEYVMVMKPNGSFAEGFLPTALINKPLDRLLKQWLAAFPHYYKYLNTLPAGKSGEAYFVPFNVDFLTLMADIAKSGFKGYWAGGDYGAFFQHDSWKGFPAVRAMAAIRPGIKRDLKSALVTVCDVSSDVDPRLFAYAQGLGLRLDFLGRTGHFMTALLEDRIATKKEVTKAYRRLARDVLARKIPSKRYLAPIYIQTMGLWDYFTGGRFNWVMAVGDDIPSLFSPDVISQVW